MLQDAISLGGGARRLPTSQFVVSVWVIPGGYDYVNASATVYFFPDEDGANAFSAKYNNPPEMAFAMSIATYDENCAQARKSNSPRSTGGLYE